MAREDRYEKKYVCAVDLAPVLEAWIRCHFAGFRTAFPPRRVNNVYFDSHSWTDLWENLSGASERMKLRLRWYGDDEDAVIGQLEMKRKCGELGHKVTQVRVRPLDLTSTTWPQLMSSLASEDLGEIGGALAHRSCPIVINRYSRSYLCTADGRVRLTVDSDMEFYWQTLSRTPNLRRAQPRQGAIVVELKAGVADHDALARVASGFPFRQTAYSKYKNCLVGFDDILSSE